MGVLRIIMDKSIMVTEANLDDLIDVLENLAVSLRSIKVNRLIIQYIDEMTLRTTSTSLP